MKYIRIMGLCFVAASLMSAVAAGTASAKPKVLMLVEHETERVVEPGEEVLFGDNNDSRIAFLANGGEVSMLCRISLWATVLSNKAKTDKMSVTSAPVEGEAEGPCGLNAGSPYGTIARVRASGLPWTLSVGSNGKAQMKGSPKITYSVALSGGPNCIYEAAKIKGDFDSLVYPSPGAPLTVRFLSHKMKRNKASSKECSKTAELSQYETAGAFLYPFSYPAPEVYDYSL